MIGVDGLTVVLGLQLGVVGNEGGDGTPFAPTPEPGEVGGGAVGITIGAGAGTGGAAEEPTGAVTAGAGLDGVIGEGTPDEGLFTLPWGVDRVPP